MHTSYVHLNHVIEGNNTHINDKGITTHEHKIITEHKDTIDPIIKDNIDFESNIDYYGDVQYVDLKFSNMHAYSLNYDWISSCGSRFCFVTL